MERKKLKRWQSGWRRLEEELLVKFGGGGVTGKCEGRELERGGPAGFRAATLRMEIGSEAGEWNSSSCR